MAYELACNVGADFRDGAAAAVAHDILREAVAHDILREMAAVAHDIQHGASAAVAHDILREASAAVAHDILREAAAAHDIPRGAAAREEGSVAAVAGNVDYDYLH